MKMKVWICKYSKTTYTSVIEATSWSEAYAIAEKNLYNSDFWSQCHERDQWLCNINDICIVDDTGTPTGEQFE